MKRRSLIGTFMALMLCAMDAFTAEKCPFVEGRSIGNTYDCGEHKGVKKGNCTWWAAHNRPDLNFPGTGRHAKTWKDRAEYYKFPTGNKPLVGAVVVFGATPNNSYGHVAYVTAVNEEDGSFEVTEQDLFGSFGAFGTVDGEYKPVAGGYQRTGSGVFPFLTFIYPTRTVKYLNDEHEGALRLDRFDGRIAQTCEDADQFVLYRKDRFGLYTKNLYVAAFNKEEGMFLCQEAFALNAGTADNYIPGPIKENLGKVIIRSNTIMLGGVGGGMPPKEGKLPDHTPDFDVFYESEGAGKEISANRPGEMGKDVKPGDPLVMRLEVKTTNRDVEEGDVRKEGRKSIDGRIMCRVAGKTEWAEIEGSEETLEYNISNLREDKGSSVERISYIVPNNIGEILECQAFVDDDDEIKEESEENNASRIERFRIVSGKRNPCWRRGLRNKECNAAITIILDD